MNRKEFVNMTVLILTSQELMEMTMINLKLDIALIDLMLWKFRNMIALNARLLRMDVNDQPRVGQVYLNLSRSSYLPENCTKN